MEFFFNIFFTLLIFLLIIGLIVFLHELGHFIAAKRSGIYVQEFAFGFGKKIWGKKYKGTLYRINLFPLGGYVKMLGDQDGSSFLRYSSKKYDKKDKEYALNLFKKNKIDIKNADYSVIEEFIEKQTIELKREDYIKLQNFLIYDYIPTHKGNFDNVSILKRAIVVSAGVFMNLLLAILLFYIYFSINGFYTDLRKIGEPKFIGTSASNPPYIAFLEGDENTKYINSLVLKVDDKIVSNEEDFNKIVEDNYNKKLKLELQILSEDGYSFKSAELILNGDGVKSNFDSDITGSPYISEIKESSIAESIGLEEGNFLYSINDVLIKTDSDISLLLSENADKLVKVKYINNIGEFIEKDALLTTNEEGKVVLGIKYSQIDNYPNLIIRLDYSDNKALGGFYHAVNMTTYNFYGIGELIKQSFREKSLEPVSSSVSSIVGVGDYVYSLVKVDDFLNILNLTALISLSLGVINILPIPLFDGGHLLFLLIEKIRGKKLSSKIQEKISAVFFYLLIAFSIIIILKDFFQMDLFNRVVNVFKTIFGI